MALQLGTFSERAFLLRAALSLVINAPKGSFEENHRATRNRNLFNMTLHCKNQLAALQLDARECLGLQRCDVGLPTHLPHALQDEAAVAIHVIGPSLQGQRQNCGELGRLLPVDTSG